jgi:hypothetical protein
MECILQPKAFELEAQGEENVIEIEERQNSGIGCGPFQVPADVGVLKMRFKNA